MASRRVCRYRQIIIVTGLAGTVSLFIILGAIFARDKYRVVTATPSCCRHGVTYGGWMTPLEEGGCVPDTSVHTGVLQTQMAAPSWTHVDFSDTFPFGDGGGSVISPWIRKMSAILSMEVQCNETYELGHHPSLTMDVRLGYQNRGDYTTQWTQLAYRTISRQLDCRLKHARVRPGKQYECQLLPLFEMYDVRHNVYIINIRLNNTFSNAVIQPEEVHQLQLITILDNPDFTKTFLYMKSCMMVLMLVVTVACFRKMTSNFTDILLNRTIAAIGVMQVIYNIPTAWLTTLPFTYIINDILEVGLLFAILLHGSALVSGDKTDLKARLKINRKLLSVVCLISLLMVLYRVVMRTKSLSDPLSSMWTTVLAKQMAVSLLILISFWLTLVLIYLTWVATVDSRSHRPGQMHNGNNLILGYRRHVYAVAVCSALVLSSIVVHDVGDGIYRWGSDLSTDNTGVVLIGLYGCINVNTAWILLTFCMPPKCDQSESSVVYTTDAGQVDIRGFRSETQREVDVEGLEENRVLVCGVDADYLLDPTITTLHA
ncbi:protein wntless-like [Haliotis cracherodii]|uniref:protein wntless-like n=1 Tax=Haliotis cracherodii TaxID=6455 RepID=UPI0039E77B2B